jgi:excinuclease UvrABC helicase subunit UvrB
MFQEFQERVKQTIYTSATPSEFEIEASKTAVRNALFTAHTCLRADH